MLITGKFMEKPCRITYEPPVVGFIEMNSEGIICESGNLDEDIDED